MRRALAAVGLVMLAGCKRSAPPPSDAPAAAASGASDAGVAPRCSIVRDLPLASDGVLFGDAVATPGGTRVGEVSTTEREARVASLDGKTWAIAKGDERIADAPPPKAAGDVAVVIAKPGVIVARLAPDGAAKRLATFPLAPQDALAFDVVASQDGKSAAIAWDADAADGGITVATIAGDAAKGPRLVSTPKSDVESPRVAPRRGGGFWVAWIARRPIAEASDASEGPAEERTTSWVEVAAIEPDLAPRRVTAATGHVGAFDLAARASGELDVIARDDTQEHEGSGGRILHVVVRDVSADEPAVLVPSGVARGSLDVLGDWLAWETPGDHLMVAPLGPSRALAAPPSAEPALDGASPLGVVPPDHFVAAFDPDPVHPGAAPLREVRCAP